jgi:hypothetical protein
MSVWPPSGKAFAASNERPRHKFIGNGKFVGIWSGCSRTADGVAHRGAGTQPRLPPRWVVASMAPSHKDRRCKETTLSGPKMLPTPKWIKKSKAPAKAANQSLFSLEPSETLRRE